MSYDRYKKFRTDGEIQVVPFIAISEKNSDIYIKYNKSKMRLDSLSYKYYGDPNYGWLILQANPGLGSMEFEIEDGSTLRIPYPLGTTIETYIHDIDTYNKLNED